MKKFEPTKNPIKCSPRNGWLGWWPGIKALFDPENGRIKEFLIEEDLNLKAESMVLDASAGEKPYADIFTRHKYESCDIPQGFYTQKHDFVCSLDDIPKSDNYYDAVLLTQVLEHVPDPERVLKEIHRILKPNGKLLLSVPLNGPLHGEPWHFFQFTHYGLNELAKKTGYKINEIEKVGGAFWFFGKHVQDLPRKIMKSVDPGRARKRGQSVFFCLLASFSILPFWITSRIVLSWGMRPICYWLDRLDSNKDMTLGYTAVFAKITNK